MKIKYIFCISTGRCGTDYLKNLLGQLDHCNAYHEQKPLLHNKIMRAYRSGEKALLQQVFPKKLSKITKDYPQLYVDTSHIFIKSFGWELPKYIPEEEIGVIVLKRKKDDVVNSTHRVHSGPFTYLGRKWILAPYKNALCKPPVHTYLYHGYRYALKLYWMVAGQTASTVKTYPMFFEKMSKKLIAWYYDETYALGNKFKATFPDITFIDIDLADINSLEGVTRMVHAFQLEHLYDPEKMMPLIGKARNLKKEFKD